MTTATATIVAPLPIPRRLSWADLIAIDPALLRLQREAARQYRADDDPDFWPRWEALKRQMSQLVGWKRTNSGPPEMYRHESYEVSYQRIFLAYSTGTTAWPEDDPVVINVKPR